MVKKLTDAESLREVLKSIEAECDSEGLRAAGGYLFRYVSEQRDELERYRKREPLMQMLVRDAIDGESTAAVTARAVRDFKVKR